MELSNLIPSEIRNSFQSLLNLMQPFAKETEYAKIAKAIEHIWNLQCVNNNKPDIQHIVKQVQIAAIIVNEIGLGVSAMLSALFFDCVRNGYISIGDIRNEYGNTVAVLIEGLLKISDVKIQHITKSELSAQTKLNKKLKNREKERISTQTANYIQLLLTLADDVRSILVKLAFCLHSMRNIQNLPSDYQFNFSSEISILYAPIAHRLGLYAVKTELEELSMKYLHEEIYQFIAKKLSETKDARATYIKEFIQPLKQLLDKENIETEIKGRPKSIFSIWKKMQKQNVEFEGIYDLFAIRIILTGKFEELRDEKADCWKVYSLITDQYTSNPKRLRDWISSPKSSGYESLHTTVLGPEGKWVEVQIRTERMDEIAEKGQAAHWKYKETAKTGSQDDWLNNIRQILEKPQIETDEVSDAKRDLYSGNIFIFTPKGDLMKMRTGATVLDFAFAIHTAVGSKCTGAKINGKAATIREELRNGDKVEIITSASQKPSEGWLKIARTPSAQAKIKQFIKEAKYKDAEAGRDMIMYKFQQLGYTFSDELTNRLRDHHRFKTTLDLYQAYGSGILDVHDIKSILNTTSVTTDRMPEKISKVHIHTPQEEEFLIMENMNKMDYELARCCSPVFGDTVFGFVSASRGTKIHRVNCPNAAELMSKYAYRIVKVRWAKAEGSNRYLTNMKVTGTDQLSIVANITALISKNEHISLRNMNISANDGTFEGNFALFVSDMTHLQRLIKSIKEIKGVINVVRTD